MTDYNPEQDPEFNKGHVYDGIQEYDNPMPRWWVNLFWATIIFSIIYCGYYMIGSGPGAIDLYNRELADAEKLSPKETTTSVMADAGSILPRLIAAAADPAKIAAGKEVFARNCLACHGAQGEGGIGPNLTDGSWIHGGKLEEILTVINKGVVEKGMIPWENTLSEEDRFAVIAFIRSIQNTNVTGKAAEGTPSDPTSLG